MSLAYRGAIGPAGGWLARAQRLIEDEPEETVEHGYLLLPAMFRKEAEGDFLAAAAIAGEAAAIGKRLGDRIYLLLHFTAMATCSCWRAACKEGLVPLDESMVAVTAGEVSPFIEGLVYCGVILACQSVFEVGRAREWTSADLVDCAAAGTSSPSPAVASSIAPSSCSSRLLGRMRSKPERDSRPRASIRWEGVVTGLAYYRQRRMCSGCSAEFEEAEQAYREASNLRLGAPAWPRAASARSGEARHCACCDPPGRAQRPASRSSAPRCFRRTSRLLSPPARSREARKSVRRVRGARGALRERDARARMVAHARGAVTRRTPGRPHGRSSARYAMPSGVLARPRRAVRDRAHASLVSRACAQRSATTKRRGSSARLRKSVRAARGRARSRTSCQRRKTDAHGLSPRELEVLRLVAAGKTIATSPSTLVISEHTVARHLQNAFREDRRLLTLRGDRVRVRKRPRLREASVVRTDH